MIVDILIIIGLNLTVFGIWFIADRIITRKRLALNQREWDEYSKDMGFKEAMEKFVPFCEEQKLKYGWRYYYFPRRNIKAEIQRDIERGE